MSIFIMATALSPESTKSPDQLEALEKQVKDKVAEHCSKVEWQANYAVLGPYDYIDVFEAPGIDDALKVASIVRSFGHARTEIWPGTDWKHFKSLSQGIGG